MEYLCFPQESHEEYKIDGTLLSHSRISPNHRARLFSWLSEECMKQRISRYAYVLTCTYLDLYFMKKNDVNIENYQALALGALILATKQVQIEGKVPIVDLKLFKLDQLLTMESNIVLGLNFDLNPPIYIELLNNVSKIWDTKCKIGQIQSNVRYFQENSQCFNRLKILYQKMDCLNLFHKILDHSIEQVVITLFYLQTRTLYQQLGQSQTQTKSEVNLPISQNFNNNWSQNSDEQDPFQKVFSQFLKVSQISSRPNSTVQKMVKMLNKQKFPINQKIQAQGRIFTQILSVHSYNKYGHQFYRKHQNEFNKL